MNQLKKIRSLSAQPTFWCYCLCELANITLFPLPFRQRLANRPPTWALSVIWHRITLSLLFLFLSFSLQAWQGFMLGTINYGNIDGFVQVPKGGTPGSTSLQRPNFSELELDKRWSYELGGGIQANNYKLWLDYHFIKVHSDRFLPSRLRTHNQTIAANSPFTMKLSYDWYALILEKTLPVPATGWEITPLISANILKSYYRFFATDIQSSRSFAHFAVNIGLKAEYFFTDLFSASWQGSITVPFSNLQISFSQIALHYQEKTKYCTLQPFLAAGILRLDLEDKQIIPNHLNFKMSPYGSLGFAIFFSA